MVRYLYITLFLTIICSGCAQRINADVSATTEEGYLANGQSVSLGPSPVTGKSLPPDIAEQLKQSLIKLGYTMPQPLQNQDKGPKSTSIPDVHVRAYWQSFGPYVSYKENPLWDFGNFRAGPWRRARFIREEHYLRTLIIEAWANKLGPHEEANAAGLAPFLQAQLSYKQALSYLPKEPARLLWRVEARSLGNLSSADKVLPELMHAALPWMSRSVDVRVMVQGDEHKQLTPAPHSGIMLP